MQSPKISIISPVYNAEKFIHKCVDSIIAQTFTDWELILVDDGSPDSSGEICDQYAMQDSRIRVIHRENGGVCAARQTGLDTVQGAYVIHADPDDWVEPAMLEDLYAKAKETDADVVICDYYVNNGAEQIYKHQDITEESNAALRGILNGKIIGSLWNKLVKRTVLQKFCAHFFSGINYCEDVLMCVQILQHPDVKLSYLPSAYYHYRVNPDSITNKYSVVAYENRCLYQKKLEEMLDRTIWDKEIRHSALNVFAEAFIGGILTAKEAQHLVWKNRKAAFCETRSPRWLFGYLCILIGFTFISKRILHY